MTTETPATAHHEAEIRSLIADQASAICAKDLPRNLGHYADDTVVFDVKPPFQIRGVAAFRRMWEACLPYFPESKGTETRDLQVHVSGDLALAHWLWRLTGIDPQHPAARMWFRTTAGYQRTAQGQWKIVHEHCSVPFDPATNQAVFTPEAA